MTQEQITFTTARRAARSLGWTMRKTGYDSEIVCYPVGTGQDAPAAYFTDCPRDALDTIRAATETAPAAPRSDLECDECGNDMERTGTHTLACPYCDAPATATKGNARHRATVAALGAFPLWAVAQDKATGAIDDALRLGWF